MDKSHLFSRTARKPRSERNCSGFFLCRGIIKRCTPLGSKYTPHRPFVKWYRGVKRKRLHGDHFRTTVEPAFVNWYRKILVNKGFYKKKLDTRFDTHCIKTGVQLVEVGGVEPPSESTLTGLSPGADGYCGSLPPCSPSSRQAVTPASQVRVMMRGTVNSFRTHGRHINDAFPGLWPLRFRRLPLIRQQ